MATTKVTIEVIVAGGSAPKPIKVSIDNIHNQNDIYFTKTTSFKETYELSAGEYIITVSGINPMVTGAQTTIIVSGNFKRGPLPKATQIAKKTFYSELFFIET